jgi:hypothetical protein
MRNIANTMRFMEHFDNSDSVTVTMVKSVMLKKIWIVYMGRQVCFSCIHFHMVQKCSPLGNIAISPNLAILPDKTLFCMDLYS